MFYDQQSVQLKVGQTSGYKVINIPFEASYVAVQNNSTQATIAIASGQLSEQPPGATVINPTKSYTGQMTAGRSVTLFWTSSAPIDANGQNEVIVSASDQPIHLQVSDNGVVVIEGTVTATFAPGQSVSIAGQPTVQFAAGQTVDVGTITETVNVQGESTVLNEILPINPMAQTTTSPNNQAESYKFVVSNLGAGAAVIANINVPFGIYDELWIGVYDDGTPTIDNNWQYKLTLSSTGLEAASGFILNPNTDVGGTGFPYDLTGSNTNNAARNTNSAIWVYKFSGSVLLSYLNVNLTNVSSSTIASDTVYLWIWSRFASATVDNPVASPVQQQSAQTMGASGSNGFFNTDGSQGTSPGTKFGVTPSGTQYITQFGLYYRNTGTVTQNILITTGGGLNIFQDNVPAGAVLDFKWDYAYGASMGDLYCTYSQANCGIINFWSNGIAYPQQHVPSTVK